MPGRHNAETSKNIGGNIAEKELGKRNKPLRNTDPRIVRLIRIIVSAICLAALLITTVLSWPSFFDIKKEGISGDIDYLPYRLAEGDQIRQSFELRSEGVRSFSLSFDLSEGWEDSENGLVVIEIFNEEQAEPLQVIEAGGKELNRFTQTEFEFNPGKTAEGEEYTLVLTVVRIPELQSISIHTQDTRLRPMKFNQREVGLALTMLLTYSVFDWPAFLLVLVLSLLFAVLLFAPMGWLGKFFTRYPAVPLAFAPLLLLIIIELFNTLNQTFLMNASVFWLTYIILLLVELALAGMLGGYRRGIYLNLVLFSSLAISNHVKLFFRGDPFVAGDLRVLTEAAQTINNLKFIIGNRFLLGWLIILIYLILFIGLEGKKKSRPWRAAISLIPLTVLVLYMNFLIMNPDRMDKMFSVSRYPWNNMMNYKHNGFTIPFFQSVHQLIIKTPDEDYKVSENFYQLPDTAITDAADPKNPHVIVVMSESYVDFNNIREIETSEPVMPFYDSLLKSDNMISGNLLVSVFGGGTCNTEFEYLTGSSMLFMNDGITPYTSYFEHKTHSLPEIFGQQGYDTLAIHPYYRTFWDRHKVYPNIGFDRFIALEDFPDGGEVRQFVGDEAAFEQIRQALGQSASDERKFIFTVTMQNHFPYYGDEDILSGLNYNIKMPGMVDVESVELYLSILRESDDALRNLVGYLETFDEPVMLVFFGDHLPGNHNVFNSFYQSLFEKPMTDLGLAETQKLYETPYFIWANYELPELDKSVISPNFLAAETIKLAGIETTPYFEMVSGLQRDIKAMSNKLIVLQNDRRINREQIPSAISRQLDRYWLYEYDNVIAEKEELNNE